MQNTTKYYRIVLRCCVVYSYPFFIIVFFIYKIPYLSLSCLRYRAATPRRIQPISTEVDRASPASVLRHKPAASQSPTLFGRARLWRRLTSKSRRRRVLGPVRQRECRRWRQRAHGEQRRVGPWNRLRGTQRLSVLRHRPRRRAAEETQRVARSRRTDAHWVNKKDDFNYDIGLRLSYYIYCSDPIILSITAKL